MSVLGVSGNTVYAVPNNLDLTWKEDLSVMEFPRDNLHFVEKLGEGQFGEVTDAFFYLIALIFLPNLFIFLRRKILVR